MKNITLIGMPGAGKSTAGIVLAKVMGYDFIDSDLLIQRKADRLLWEILEEDGIDAFTRLEEEIINRIQVHNSVISTGGSAVYSEKSMIHLKNISTVVYLKVSYKGLKKRLGDMDRRGVVLRPGQSLKDLYRERVPLYEKYADYTISSEDMDVSATVCAIADALRFQTRI